jgi:hypothetical protein
VGLAIELPILSFSTFAFDRLKTFVSSFCKQSLQLILSALNQSRLKAGQANHLYYKPLEHISAMHVKTQSISDNYQPVNYCKMLQELARKLAA